MNGSAWKKFACCRPARVAALALALAAGLGLAGCRTYRAPVAPDFSQEMADRAAAIDLVRAGQRLEYAGKEALAEDKYRQAVNLYRETPSAWNNLGRLLMKRGANEEARVAFLISAELSPRDPMPLYNLGALWDNMGYLDDAGRWYEEALSRDENFQPALRRSILVDQMLRRGNEVTARRVQRALLQETDPWWIERLQRERVRLAEELRAGRGRRGEDDYLKRPTDERPAGLPPFGTDPGPLAEPLPR
ncbi:MAG: hypothetical protein KF869_07085 [Phycisphaeraceae bacterium]|nr:hypothetical protein [Phycisphaeraceae bacterium]